MNWFGQCLDRKLARWAKCKYRDYDGIHGVARSGYTR
ncbi:hypothetical protein LMG29542_08287 [Paraburkholderia humisilvae]|uniref:Uncharacterized protein n=1 Tax=Paraburkholderia humisilvae TaxID=627669 RepID=A0A6J5FCF4_9BURK|nr:hypothetical protein LMG29542_08287 [Paraburkholderia humisilvae]